VILIHIHEIFVPKFLGPADYHEVQFSIPIKPAGVRWLSKISHPLWLSHHGDNYSGVKSRLESGWRTISKKWWTQA